MTFTQFDWLRVTRQSPCAICGSPDWCGVTRDRTAYICMRVENGAIRETRNGGYLHRQPGWTGRRGFITTIRAPATKHMTQLAIACRRELGAEELRSLASELSLSRNSLRRLAAGWLRTSKALSFPMRDDRERIIGIRLRARKSGAKFAVTDSHEGLFIPKNVSCSGRLFITEGPTDCAALLDCGLNAIGRPSCSGGRQLVLDFVRRMRPREVVVVADRDGAGKAGARKLGAALLPYCAKVRVITPPRGAKDAREWRMIGATGNDVLKVVRNTQPLRLLVSWEGAWRKNER
jgi:hypothetical protein